MNSSIASLLGRPDLGGQAVDMYGGTSGIYQGNSVQIGANAGATADGRLLAMGLIAVLLAYVGFYVWTRDIQA